MIGIAGGSGSGKTTLVKAFLRLVSIPVSVLSQDFYYRDLSHLPPKERANVNFDHPAALDIFQMALHIDELTAGRNVGAPEYDFGSHTQTGVQTIASGRILLVEGTLIFAIPEIRSRIDLAIFIDAPDKVRLQRRRERDRLERERAPKEINRQYKAIVRPMYEQFIAPTKEAADRILDGTQPIPALAEHLHEIVFQAISSNPASSPTQFR